jgi:hypothetical protein
LQRSQNKADPKHGRIGQQTAASSVDKGAVSHVISESKRGQAGTATASSIQPT